jgi:membrane protein DedA with SNARE-associated domain
LEGAILQETIETILDLAEAFGPLGFLVGLTLSSFGFPFSKSIALIVAGMLGGMGRGSHAAWFSCLVLGLHFGDLAMLTVGRIWGERVFHTKLVKRLIKHEHIERARQMVSQYGLSTMLFARVTPFVRNPCYILLGSLRISPLRFTLINIGLTIPYTAVFYIPGVYIGNQPEQVWRIIQSSQVLFISIAIIVGSYLVVKWRKRLARAQQVREELGVDS